MKESGLHVYEHLARLLFGSGGFGCSNISFAFLLFDFRYAFFSSRDTVKIWPEINLAAPAHR